VTHEPRYITTLSFNAFDEQGALALASFTTSVLLATIPVDLNHKKKSLCPPYLQRELQHKTTTSKSKTNYCTEGRGGSSKTMKEDAIVVAMRKVNQLDKELVLMKELLIGEPTLAREHGGMA
jgi:hypothetical protein